MSKLKPERNLMSKAAYARHSELSPSRIGGLVKAGKLKTYDGMIDQVEADAWRAQNVRVDRRRKGKAEDTEEVLDNVTTEPDQKPTGVNMNKVRTAHESIKMEIAHLDLRRKRGELVERVLAVKVFFNEFRAVRDSFLNWPSRVASVMAGELGVDPKRMQEVLDKYMRDQLDDLAARDMDAALTNVLGGEDADESNERSGDSSAQSA